MSRPTNAFRLLAELHKYRITIAVTLTTLAGFALATGTIDKRIILPLIGIFLLSSGAASLNQYQERKMDSLMIRTRNRPIPSGRIKPSTVVIIASLEIIFGTLLVYIGSNLEAAILGFLAFVWYNIIYTPLKKITPFAVIPGSVIGAIPPMVGWVVGGGSITDIELIVLSFFFFISQVPHFWLLMLEYGEDYKTAGFPVITDILNSTQIKRATFIWIVATAMNIVLLVIVGLFQTLFFKIVVLISAVWLIVAFSKLIRKYVTDFQPFKHFLQLNYFLFVIILSMILDPLF